MTKKQISELVALLEEVYESNDELLWEEIFYKINYYQETAKN